MRTVDFSPILFESIQLSGQDRHYINSETFAQVRDIINQRIRYIWELQQWPFLIKFVQQTITVNPAGIQMVTLPADAAEVFDCYASDPRVTTKNSLIDFDLYEDNGVEKLIFNAEPASEVWIRYRIKSPEINGDLFDNTVAYSPGAQVYFDTGSNTGTYIPAVGKPHSANFYTCLDFTTAGQSPSTHAAKWQKIEIPYAFRNYLPRAFAADYLRSEMQVEAAQIAENDAMVALDHEIDKLLRQQGQVPKLRFQNPY